MAQTKIFELGESLSLSSQHMNLYCENRHWDLRCELLPEREWSDLKNWLPYVEAEAAALRLPLAASPEVLKNFPNLPAMVRWLECGDSLVHENKEWWPRLFSYEALRKLIIQHEPNLDISHSAFVIGSGRAARLAAAAIAALGFSNICLVDENTDALQAEAVYLRRFLLGVEIGEVEAHTLTRRKTAASLLVNTMAFQDDSTVLGDLSYFNFMSAGGAVVDFSEVTLTSTLLEEARQASLSVLSGVELQCQWDVDFLKAIVPQNYITFEDYLESFSEMLSKAKNSPSV